MFRRKWRQCVAVVLIATTVATTAICWQQQGTNLSTHSGSVAQQWKSNYLQSQPLLSVPQTPLQVEDVEQAVSYINQIFVHVAEAIRMHVYFAGQLRQRLADLQPYFIQTNQDEFMDIAIGWELDAYEALIGDLEADLMNHIEYRNAALQIVYSDLPGEQETGLLVLSSVLDWAKRAVAVSPGMGGGTLFVHDTLQAMVETLEAADDMLKDREANKVLQDAYIQAGASI